MIAETCFHSFTDAFFDLSTVILSQSRRKAYKQQNQGRNFWNVGICMCNGMCPHKSIDYMSSLEPRFSVPDLAKIHMKSLSLRLLHTFGSTIIKYKACTPAHCHCPFP